MFLVTAMYIHIIFVSLAGCSDDLSERFYRDIEFIERNYDAKDPIKMLGSHVYSIVHEKRDIEERRKKHRYTFG